MINLNRLLPKLLSGPGGNIELAVKLAWGRAAGTGLRRHAVPLHLREKTLVVAVADQIWQKQLEHMSAELTSRTNKVLGQTLVETLVFRIDPQELAAEPRALAAEPGEATVPDDLLFAARSIADRDLRERFVRAAGNCISRREARAANDQEN